MKEPATIYISGPMTGIQNHNYEAFHEAEGKLSRAYVHTEILNPASFFMGDQNLPRETYLKKDIEAVLKADAIAMLPGWENSKGACLEKAVAEAIGHQVIYLSEEKPESILLEAERLTNGDRNEDYGHPLDDFTKTAVMWGVIIGADVTAEHIALCMVALKISRELNKPKRDNLVDGAGYFNCLHKLHEERERRAKL